MTIIDLNDPIAVEAYQKRLSDEAIRLRDQRFHRLMWWLRTAINVILLLGILVAYSGNRGGLY